MDELQKINRIELRGTLADRPRFSHENRDERFFVFPIEIPRLSGSVDRINILAREEQLKKMEICSLPKLFVAGELRSFNNKSGEGSRLIVTVFARELRFDDGESINAVWLTGTICKPPNLRTTPMGREICDLMVAVNRRYGRSDYLPCIAWGLRAKEVAFWPVGTNVSVFGRIQSRNYIKNMDGMPIEKTTYEVSATELTEIAKP